MYTVEMVSAVCCTPWRWGDNFVIEYLGEIEAEFENTACLSGAQMGLNHEQYWGRKSRDTLPLR